ncbi:MAG: glycosyltransferase [Thermodesulforhabdaceae bacterium]
MPSIVVPVSVVITTFNRARFIEEAVRSVLSQRRVVPLEVIVVDDGSTDETPKIMEAFRCRVKYVFQNNRGVSSARNHGIMLSSGEWIAFLDSDDLWLPHKLFHHWRFCLENPHILISQTDELWLRRGTHLNPRKYHEKPEGYCFDRLLERCLISPSAVMIHRSIFTSVGFFDERLPACEDYDLWLRIGYQYPVGLVRNKLVIKRGGHEDQLSSSIKALDRFRIFAMVKLLLHEPLSTNQRQAVIKELSNKCKIYALGAKKRSKTLQYEFFLALPALVQEGRIRDETDLFPYMID